MGEVQEIQNEKNKNDVKLPVVLTKFLLVLRRKEYAVSMLRNVKEQFSLITTEATKPNTAQHNIFHVQKLPTKEIFASIVKVRPKPISK